MGSKLVVVDIRKEDVGKALRILSNLDDPDLVYTPPRLFVLPQAHIQILEERKIAFTLLEKDEAKAALDNHYKERTDREWQKEVSRNFLAKAGR